MDQRLPDWLRLIVGASALMQVGFGLSLLIEPGLVGQVWPWAMPPLTTRILAASTLVSVPLALLSIGFNRFSIAAIPFVMMATYRVLQLLAGLMHLDRFGANLPMTVNYFGGGTLMMAVLLYGLWMGLRGRLPVAAGKSLPWHPARLLRIGLALLGTLFIALGTFFFFKAGDAGLFWFDARGITPLTARLFSSPLTGLGLGMIMVSRMSDWRAVAVPGVAMCTIGIVVLVSFALSATDFAPRTTMAWLVAATPLALLAAGIAILASRPRNTIAGRA